MILGRRAHHGGSADVDVLDRIFDRAAGLRDRRATVEVDDDQVDRRDVVLAHDGFVDAASAEQAAVNLRVQRFYATSMISGKPVCADTA